MNKNQIEITISADSRSAEASSRRLVTELSRVDAAAGRLGTAFSSVDAASARLTGQLGRIDAAANSSSGSADRLSSAIGRVAHYALAGGGLVALVSQVQAVGSALYQASAAGQRLTTQLNLASNGRGKEEMVFVSGLANRLGLELNSTAKAYAGFASAARGTALEGEKTRSVFTAIASAAAVSGLSADETSGALLAVQQMMAKGVVNAEEFRGQLGERMPIAMQAAAAATGKTAAEFTKLLESGKLVSEDFLPKFAAAIDQLLGKSVEDAAASLDAAANRMTNAWERLKTSLGDSGISTSVASLSAGLTADLTVISEAMDRAKRNGGGFFGQMNSGLGALIGRTLGLQAVSREFMTLDQRVADASATLARLDEQERKYGKLSIYSQSERAAAARDLAAANRELAASGGKTEALAGPDLDGNLRRGAEKTRSARENALKDARTKYATKPEKLTTELDRVRTELGGAIPPDLEERIRAAFAEPVAKEVKATQSALEKYRAMLADLTLQADGFSANFDEQVKTLRTGWTLSGDSVEVYNLAYERLVAKQPSVIKAASERARLYDEVERIIDAEIAAAQQSAKGVPARVQDLQDEETAARLAASSNITLATALEQLRVKRLEEAKAQALAGGDQARAQALQQEIDSRKELARLTDGKARRENASRLLDDYLKTDIGADLAAGFDAASQSLGTFVSSFSKLVQEQRDYNKAKAESVISTGDLAALESAHLNKQLRGYGDLAGAAKGLLSKKTAGYKALTAAENALRIFEIASATKTALVKMSLTEGVTAAKVMGDQMATASSLAAVGPQVAAATAIGQANAVAGVANQANGDPYSAFPRMAAMAAIMLALGFAVSGAGGSGGGFAPTNEGTGTVLGDKDAKSESISKAIEALKDVDTLTMRYSAQMLASLRSIESNIGGLATLLIRSGAIEASGAGIQTGFKQDFIGKTLSGSLGGAQIGSMIGGALAGPIGVLAGAALGAIFNPLGKLLGGLFGSSTKIKGQGIAGAAQSLTSILSAGFQAQYYTDVQTKKKTLGFTTSTKNRTYYTDADVEFEDQIGKVFTGFYDALAAAAKPLGENLDVVRQRLDSFVINIGRVQTSGLSGTDLQERLTAVFSAQGDLIAKAAFGGFEQFQRVGEGYFETIARIASSTEEAGAVLRRLGIEAVALMDVANAQGDVGAEIVRQSALAVEGLSGVADILAVLDGSAAEIAETYTALTDVRTSLRLLGLSGDAVTFSLLEGAGGLQELTDAVQAFEEGFTTDSERISANAERLAQRLSALGLSLPSSGQGFADMVRGIDTSTAAGQTLLGSVLALSGGFADLMSAIESVGAGIADEIARIKALTETGTATSMAELQTNFAIKTAQARAGDQAAIEALPALSQALLKATEEQAASSLDVAMMQAQTMASLQATLDAINDPNPRLGKIPGFASGGWFGGGLRLVGENGPELEVTGPSRIFNAGQTEALLRNSGGNETMVAEIRALRAELAALREQQQSEALAIARNTGTTARLLERVMPDGDSISVVIAQP
jgi:tape measure domain-containing protein